MDSLKRLISRLTHPRGVSNEDAFDTVKQYWDDVTSGFWQDTDEELADELGVTPTALAELLEVHRHIFNYANIGGNSSVRGYDHGEDWLVVMFSDGSRYLYTLKSTDQQTLDYMRRLAMAGKGLNSYITRIVGPNYAGRNYKGTITIKPGMEQYNPEGYRRLLLIQAFRNTMTIKTVTPDQVTLEKYKAQITDAGSDGLDPIARGIMAVGLESMGYGAKVSLEYIDDQPVNETQALEGIIDNALSGSMEGFWDSIKDFFAGRPTKVHLAGSDPGLRSKLNSTINDRTWLSRQKYTLGEVNYKALPDFNPSTAAQMVNNYRSAVSMAVQHNKREMSKINDRLRAVNNCFALYSQRDIFDTSFIKIVMDDINPYVVRLNINIKEPDLTPQAMVTQTGSALTKVEIKQFAELIGQVFDSQSSFAGSISVNSSLNYQANLNFRYANKPGGAAVLAALRQLQQQYQHLVVMINREIKQRISTHTAWIVAENLADSMVNYIAKSISNVSSNESFVGKPQASNEGIWGAVRYLFGGNYEDLPKINAAYDEAVDAVKATYANPEWVKKRRLNTGKPIKLASHYFSEIANDPAKALERVKKENRKAVDDVIQYVKEEVEYLSKFTKALSSGDEVKIKALLDMFEVRKVRSLDVAEELGFDHGDEVKGMSAEQIHKAAEVFIDGINYRRSTDAFYTQGMYKLMYTEAGNIRYGDGGAVTEKLNGPAKELAIKIGQSADNVERSFYNSFGPAWENVDRVVKTTLAIMEASAK